MNKECEGNKGKNAKRKRMRELLKKYGIEGDAE